MNAPGFDPPLPPHVEELIRRTESEGWEELATRDLVKPLARWLELAREVRIELVRTLDALSDIDSNSDSTPPPDAEVPQTISDDALRSELVAVDFSPFVVRLLLARIVNDLRSVELLTSRSFVAQAATIASSLFETAHAIGYIGSDAERAATWMLHNDPKRTYPSLKKAVEAARALLGIANPEAVAEQLALYGWLCQAKHANPMFQRAHGLIYNSPQSGSYRIEPEADPDTVVWARQVLVIAVDLAHRAMLLTFASRLDLDPREAQDRITALANRIDEIEREVYNDLPPASDVS